MFRSLKSELGLRPVYHHKEVRVDGHLFITVLAYQFVQIIRRQLKEHGIHDRWSTLRDILSVQQRVTASFRRADGGILHIRKSTQPEAELARIYHTLGLDPASWRCTKNSTIDRISLKNRPCSALRSFTNQEDIDSYRVFSLGAKHGLGHERIYKDKTVESNDIRRGGLLECISILVVILIDEMVIGIVSLNSQQFPIRGSKRVWGVLGEDVGSRELPPSPHGWVYGVPRQAYPTS